MKKRSKVIRRTHKKRRTTIRTTRKNHKKRRTTRTATKNHKKRHIFRNKIMKGGMDSMPIMVTWGDLAATPLPDSSDSFFQNYVIEKVLSNVDKGSVSDTLIIFAHHRITGFLVAVKLFINDHSEDNERFNYESCVYRNVTTRTITNIVRWVSTQNYTHPQFMTSINEMNALATSLQEFNQINNLYQQVIFKTPSLEDITIIISERRENASKFYDLYQPLSNADKKNLLYQIIFTLSQLEEYGIQHNDLHLSNLLLDMDPDENKIGYLDTITIPPTERILPIKYKVLFFDWDLSSFNDRCGVNAYLNSDFCPKYGICNDKNIRFDIYTLLRSYEMPGDPDFIRFRKYAGILDDVAVDVTSIHKSSDVVIDTTRQVAEAFDSRMCNLNPGFDDTITNQKCIPFLPVRPSFILPPSQLIYHPYFNDLFVP
jgi:serine/threonine protein kinase